MFVFPPSSNVDTKKACIYIYHDVMSVANAVSQSSASNGRGVVPVQRKKKKKNLIIFVLFLLQTVPSGLSSRARTLRQPVMEVTAILALSAMLAQVLGTREWVHHSEGGEPTWSRMWRFPCPIFSATWRSFAWRTDALWVKCWGVGACG